MKRIAALRGRAVLRLCLVTTLALTTTFCESSDSTGPGDTPTIALSTTAAGFSATAGGANPASATINVTNGGGGSLSGLTTSLTYGAGQPTGWLVATIGATTAPTTLNLSAVTGSLAAGAYTAQVAVAAAGASNSPVQVSVIFTVTGVSTPPSAPSALSATPTGSTQIGLSWTDNANNESGFEIDRCTGAACTTFAQIATVGPNVVSYQSTGLTAATTYRYRVRATNGAGDSGDSNIASATTSAVAAPPAAPTNLTAAAASATQINLSWTDNANNESGFEIDRCAGASCTTFAQIATVGANVVSYQSTGLTASSTYRYRVRATNGDGDSSDSNIASATTSATPAPPAAPTNLVATAASATQINLSWTDNASNETGFEIDRCAGASCTSFVQIGTVGANVLAYLSTGLTASTLYRYRVRATNADGDSGDSNIAQATTNAAPTPPTAPSNLVATAASATQINLTWTDNSGNETGFEIDRCTGAGCSTFVEIATVGANVVSYPSTGLTASTTYQYRVRATNGDGDSGNSNVASATTTVAPPNAPTSLIATTASTSQINLSWTDNSTNETGFRVEYCTGAACTGFVELGTLGANDTSEPIVGLSGATTYRFQVRAYNAGGNSAYTNIASATTQGEQTFLANADNLLLYNSTNSTIGNTSYPSSENGLGYSYFYDIYAFLTGYIGAASTIYFNVDSQIAGKTILEARLILSVYQLQGDPVGTDFQVNALASFWPGTLTWNQWQSSINHYVAGAVSFESPATAAVPLSLNITQIVQNWANGTFTNYGLLLWDPAPFLPGYSSIRAMSFYSLEFTQGVAARRPQLYIRYQ